MSLSVFNFIYDGMVGFFGASCLVWIILFITALVLFSTLLRVPYMIVLIVCALPFLVMAIYAVIIIEPWISVLVLFTIGLLMAISIYKLITR